MKIDHPAGSQIPHLRRLWKEVFGDTDAFLDSFFATGYAPERCRCVSEDGGVQAALYWLDLRCGGQKFAYIYAVATAPAHRGKGLCRRLMEDTARVLQDAGYQAALLVPQDRGLRTMYSKMGYQDAATLEEFFCAAGPSPAPIREITAEEYAARRAAVLPPECPCPVGAGLAFLATQARFYEGADFLAFVSRETEHLRVLEFLGDQETVPGFVAALGRTEGTIRAPGGTAPFAMYRPLSPDCIKPGYYPFAFD